MGLGEGELVIFGGMGGFGGELSNYWILAIFPRFRAGKEGAGTISNAEVSCPLSALSPTSLAGLLG